MKNYFMLLVIFMVAKVYIISKKEIREYIKDFTLIFKMIHITIDFISIVIMCRPGNIYDIEWMFVHLYTINNMLNNIFSIIKIILKEVKR